MISPDSSRPGRRRALSARPDGDTDCADRAARGESDGPPGHEKLGITVLGKGFSMAAKVARHFSLARASIIVFGVVALLTALFMIQMSQGQAAPTTPTDATKVPHYFGPWPNWALSPLTSADATVTITGDGAGARGGGHGRRQRRRHRHRHHQSRQRLHDRHGEHHRRRRRRRGDRHDHQQRRHRRRQRDRQRRRLQGARRHHLGRRRDHRRHRERVRRRGLDHPPERRHGLPVPHGGLRHAGRPQRRQGAGGGRQGPEHRRDHGHQHHQRGLGLPDRAERGDPRRHTARPGGQRRRRRLRRRHHQRHQRRPRHVRRRLHRRAHGHHHRLGRQRVRRHRLSHGGQRARQRDQRHRGRHRVRHRRRHQEVPGPAPHALQPRARVRTRQLRRRRGRQQPRQVPPGRRARGEDLPRPGQQAHQVRRVRDRAHPVPQPSSTPTCRRRWCVRTCRWRRPPGSSPIRASASTSRSRTSSSTAPRCRS